MRARSALVAALVLVTGCAGLTPVGRSAARAPAPPTEVEAVAPATTPAPVAQVQAPPPVAAPQVTAPPPVAQSAPPNAPQNAPRAEASAGDRDIIVRSGRETQVPPPAGDPRSMSQRMEDVRAWDQCVTAVQSAFDSDPMRPQLETPEEYCSRSLGMAERTAVPLSRRQR